MKKTLLATMIVSTFGLTACGGDSGTPPPTVTPTSSTPLTISGVVNKGIVKDGAVTVCLATVANTSNKSCANVLATGTTDTKGAFDLSNIDLEVDKPVLLVVKANSEGTTQMKCDLAASCTDPNGNTIEFGEWMPVADTYKRIAIITPTVETTTANITNLSHLAAEKAIASAGNSDVSAATVKAAQQTVAKKLGLEADIQALGSVDITDPSSVAAVSAENSDEVTAALYSAALNTFFDDEGNDIDGDAATLITDTNGDTTAETTVDGLMAELKSSADTIATSVQDEINASEDEDVATAASSILTSAQTTVAEADPAAKDSVTEAEASETLTQTDIDRAKALITQIRTTATAVQDGTVEGAFSDFGDEVTPVTDLMAADMDGLTDKLSQAIAAVILAYQSTADVTSSYIASSDDEKTFTVAADGVSLVATINSATVIEIPNDGTNTCDDVTDYSNYSCDETDSGRTLADIDITFNSLTITQGNTTLTLDEDVTSQILVTNFDSSWSDSYSSTASNTQTSVDEAVLVDDTFEYSYSGESSGSDSSSGTDSADKIKVVLNGATLSYSTSDGDNTFTGTLSFDLVNPIFTYEDINEWAYSYEDVSTISGALTSAGASTEVTDDGEEYTYFYWNSDGSWEQTGTYTKENSWSGSYISSLKLTSLSFEISGDITVSSGNTAGAQLNATITNSGGYTLDINDAWDYAYSYLDTYAYNSSTGTTDESGDGTSTPLYESDTESETLTNSSGASETSSSYIAATVNAQITSDITNANNVDVATSVGLKVSRASLTSAAVTLDVGYNGTSTVFKTVVDSLDTDGALDITITGSDDLTTIASLNVSESGAYQGKITVDGEQAASISDSSGVPYIYYYDGTEETEFQSLF